MTKRGKIYRANAGIRWIPFGSRIVSKVKRVWLSCVYGITA